MLQNISFKIGPISLNILFSIIGDFFPMEIMLLLDVWTKVQICKTKKESILMLK